MKEKLKPYKTVEQIAKKHRMDVSDIQKQLDMGAPIEHEHTKNQKLAVEIALQHLDEFPDYYTRLKKMEASAKKEHKKFKDVKEGLRDWYGDSQSKGGKPGWVNVVTGGTCASDEPGEGVPKCVSSEKRASMTEAERLSAARRKKTADKNQQSKSGATKPTYVSTDKPEKKMNEEKDIKGKGSGKKDACYKKVKSRYDVWPSAYASGALVKCRKVGTDNWGTKTEEAEMVRYCPKCEKDETRKECKYGEKYWDMFSIPSSLSQNQIKFSIAQVHPANESKEPDHEYSMARSELSTIISAAKRLRGKLNGEGNIEAWVQSKITKAADYIDAAADYLDSGEHNVQGSMDEACWKGYKKKGMKTMFGKRYPNCVKVKQSESYTPEGGQIDENQGPSTPVKYDPHMKQLVPNMGAGRPGNVRLKPHFQIPLATNTSKKSNVQMASYEPEGEQLQEKPGDGYLGPTPIPNPIRLAQDVVDATNRTSQKKVDIVNNLLGPGRASMPKTTYFNKGPSAASQKYLNLKNSYEPEIKSFTKFMNEASAAWQRKEGKNPKGGLNAAGVASYRKENPGSKLQTAVTTKPSKLEPGSKDAKRRKSFCARMSGMPGPTKDEKGRPTRKTLSLRKWNCN